MLNNIIKGAASCLDFPEEILLNNHIITIAGRNNIFVQNFKQLKEYTDTTVKIAAKGYIIVITGINISIKAITDDYIHIIGFITQINYNTGEKNE